MKENNENWLETIYRDEDEFDTYILVSEAKALLKYIDENRDIPNEMGGLVERICIKLEELGIDF